MSPDNPTQILTTHNVSQLRTLQGVTTATVVAAAAQAVNTVTNGLKAINTTTQQQQGAGAGAGIGDDIGTRHQFLSNTNNQVAPTTTTTTTTTSITTTPHDLSNLLEAATAAVAAGGGVSKGATFSTHSSTVGGTIISNKNNKTHTSHLTFAGTVMPATSKYVLLEQSRSGQFTPFDPSNASGGMGDNNGSGVPPTGGIVVLATEPFDTTYDHNQHNGEGSGGLDNDEELRSLTWLNNSNLIKEIVTTTSSTTSAGSMGNHKRSSLSNNICIVSASSAGNRLSMCNDVIKEIISHPRQIMVTGSEEVNSGSEAQITTMSVSDFQQQFKRFSSLDLKDQSISLSNIAQLGATTMYVGPSGTTTVVEYKTGPNILSSTPSSSRQQVLNGSGTAVTSAILTTNNTISNASNSSSSSVPFSSVGTLSSNINKNSSGSNNNNNAALILSNNQCNSNVITTATTIKGGVGSKHHSVLPKHTAFVANGNLTAQSNANNNTNNNNNNHIRSNNINNGYSNHTPNTNYQGHKQKMQQPHGLAPGTQNGIYLNKNGNNYKSNNSSNNGTGISSSTTHHPHKKYLREKMNVLDQGGGSGGGGCGDGSNATSNLPSDTTSSTNPSNITVLTQHNCPPNSVISSSPLLNAMGSTITVVSSPASSNSSLSTAAVNGGNSPPLNKTLSFFTLNASNTPISLNYAPTDAQCTTAALTATTAAAETEQRINISPFIGSAVSNTNTSVPSSSNLLVSTTVTTLPATSLMSYTAITSNQIPVGYTLVNHPMSTPPSPAAAYHHLPQQQQQRSHHNAVVDSISTTTAVTSLTSATATTISVPLQQHTPNAVISTPPPAALSLNEMQTPFSQMQNATKEYFTLNSTSQQQQNQQQQQMFHSSPISYSSYDDSLKDFEITPNTQRIYNNNNNINGLQRNSPNSKQQHIGAGQMVSNSNNVYGGGVMPGTPQKQKHPNNVPYDPLVHTHNKPPYSFSSLIFMAIEGSQEKALPVKEIYAWIVQHFPYFKTAPTGWKNSVRHNLSLNKSFVKVEKAPNMGKGSLWRVEQQQRQNLIQALNRSPFFQNPAIDKGNIKSPNGGATSGMPSAIISANDFNTYDVVDGPKATNSTLMTTPSSTHITSRFDPTLFPNLSKAFKDINDVVADVPDDDYPSDYSTTTITDKQTSCSSSNQSNKYNTTVYLNKNNNNNNNQKKSQMMSDDKGDKIMNSVMDSSRGSLTTTNIIQPINPFGHYESIERLARDCGADSIDDVNAATAMLALKHGPKVFTESFQNGVPVITSSPSEDHTYSAGGAGGSSPSTSLNNGSSSLINSGSGGYGSTKNKSIQGCGDNQSNCASSDAAYESSEECHNVSPEELENQKRHLDGVDALLTLSLSSVMETSSNISNSHASSHSSTSPNKRPSTTSNEEEHHLSAMCNNNYNNNSSSSSSSSSNNNNNNNTYHVIQPHNMSKMALLTTAATANVVFTNNSANNNNNNNNNNTKARITASNFSSSDTCIADEGYNTQTYFGSNSLINGNSQQQCNYPTHNNLNHHTTTAIVCGGVKKPKPLRSLRTKIKRKAPWMR